MTSIDVTDGREVLGGVVTALTSMPDVAQDANLCLSAQATRPVTVQRQAARPASRTLNRVPSADLGAAAHHVCADGDQLAAL